MSFFFLVFFHLFVFFLRKNSLRPLSFSLFTLLFLHFSPHLHTTKKNRTDYVATRWYRAPELCGSFFARYSPAIDVWSIGCIFAEVLQGKPLFPGRNVVHQLELITDLLGTPPPEVTAKVRNEKARRFLLNMRPKPAVPLERQFPRADPAALRLLARLLAFDPAARPTAEEALADPYFAGLASPAREPAAAPVSKLAFEFERRKLAPDDVRELIYREILEYHPQMLAEHLAGNAGRQANFLYPSAVDNFKRQFAAAEVVGGGGVPGTGGGGGGGGVGGGGGGGGANGVGGAGGGAGGGGGGFLGPGGLGQATSLPRERVREFQSEAARATTTTPPNAAATRLPSRAPTESASTVQGP